MRSLLSLSRVNLLLFVREPAALFFTLVFPLLLLIVFGAMFGNEPGSFGPGGVGPPGFGYIDLQVPALASIIIGTVGLIGIPIATASMREMGVLRRFRATPIHPAVILASDILVNLALSVVGMAVLVVVGRLQFGLRFEGSWGAVLVGFLFAACAFFALGYLIASLAPTARVAQTVGFALFFPLMFLSGAALPRFLMPETVRDVSEYLPLTHVVDFMQGLWAGAPLLSSRPEFAWLAGLLVVGVLLSARFFRWE